MDEFIHIEFGQPAGLAILPPLQAPLTLLKIGDELDTVLKPRECDIYILHHPPHRYGLLPVCILFFAIRRPPSTKGLYPQLQHLLYFLHVVGLFVMVWDHLALCILLDVTEPRHTEPSETEDL